MRGRSRQLLVLTLAILIVGGLLVADAVTLAKAKPSFRNETQAFQKLIQSTGTTTTTTTTPHSSRPLNPHTGVSSTTSP